MIALKLPERDVESTGPSGCPSTPASESACLVSAVEALLFSTDAPASVASLARALGALEGQVEQALELLRDRLDRSSGIQVVQIAGGYQLCTRPEYAELVAGFLKPQRNRLSRSLLEVLAIVAYRQPVTLAEIDLVRGVQSDYSVRQLVERGLIAEAGRKKAPGRPMLFATTQQFLHLFHLKDLSELPPIECGVDARMWLAAAGG
jgi:segregation and condensation protein B